jgi:NitT/TauT family transport system ATP-binding protein
MTGVLELSGVGKDFRVRGRTVRALEGIDLTVTPGDFVCVVGASGSGKSTLLSLVAGLATPTDGSITLDGTPVLGPGPDRGLVPQAGTLYPWRTVERNVAFGLELLPLENTERAKRIDWYLAETGLTALRHSLPRQLSGGQQQRVAIARALAQEPEVMLFDEPTSALDPEMRDDVMEVIRGLARGGMTMLVVTHEMQFAHDIASRVWVIDRGTIAEDGPPSRVVDHPQTSVAREFFGRLRRATST